MSISVTYIIVDKDQLLNATNYKIDIMLNSPISVFDPSKTFIGLSEADRGCF